MGSSDLDLTPEPPVMELSELVERISEAAAGTDRFLVGIAGPPGVGKSTAAAWLAGRLDRAVVVPMDGFHLAQSVLDAAGTADRKGAPHTFDAAGFIALLRRLRTPSPDETVFAPRFDRDLEEPIAGAIDVGSSERIVVVEGNYLLVDDGPWSAVRSLLDVVVHLDLDPTIRVQRLVDRHIAHGRDAAAARRWVEHNDDPNATLVESCRSRADAIVPVRSAGPAETPEA
ncbi:MAG: nucleoside/nucleotide kinase family protein [Actinomycetota bacterium]